MMSKRHKYKPHTREEVLAIGKQKYCSGGFMNPTMAEVHMTMTRPLQDLLNNLQPLVVEPPPPELN
jgi:hypothetical protein